jgi:hypothetical protein
MIGEARIVTLARGILVLAMGLCVVGLRDPTQYRRSPRPAVSQLRGVRPVPLCEGSLLIASSTEHSPSCAVRVLHADDQAQP